MEHHDWLLLFGKTEKYLRDISKVKLQQFSTEAKSLDASDFKEMNIYRRYSLIICLLDHAQRRAKDGLAIMYCRTMAKMHKKAEEKYALLREQQVEKTKHLLNAFCSKTFTGFYSYMPGKELVIDISIFVYKWLF